MNQGKFNLRSWASNSSLLQARTAEDNTNEKSEKLTFSVSSGIPQLTTSP